MTGRASDALGHMNAVIEINVVGQAVDANPRNRMVGAVALADWLQVPGAVEQHGVAVHAGFGWRNARGRREFHARMAIPAIDAIIPDVVLVTELNRLIARYVLIRQIGRTRRQQNPCQRQTRQKKRGKDTETGDEIRAAVKNLGHVYICTLKVSAPEGSGNLGVQNPIRDVPARVQFDAMSFQQNFLECNCPTLFRYFL